MKIDSHVPRNPRALIFKLGQIGDIIMAIPAVYELHCRGFKITWLCGEATRPLLECYSWIHLIPVSDRALLLGNFRERFLAIKKLWEATAGRSWDLCAILYYDRRFRWLMFPVLAKIKITLSLHDRNSQLIPGRHQSDEFRRIILKYADDVTPESMVPVRPDKLPLTQASDKTRVRIAIVPGGTKNIVSQQTVRRWPVEHYKMLANVFEERGWETVLIGGPGDEWIKPHFNGINVTDCVANLSLPNVLALFDTCDCVISHDTGPMHLAGLSDACLIGIFGPTNPTTFLPRRPYSVGIWGGQGFACRPCYDGREFAPCTYNGCMHQVTPDLVLKEMDNLLNARSKSISMPWRIVTPEPHLTTIVNIGPNT